MPINQKAYELLSAGLHKTNTILIAVSKKKPASDILALYELGHRDFGENYVQELVEKSKQLPADIRWHFIGHLQSNKVKLILPFVQLIHGVDSLKLLEEVNKQSAKLGKVTSCLLQVHIAKEETKFGLDETELQHIIAHLKEFTHVKVSGLMGMASLSDDMDLVRSEFRGLKKLFDKYSIYPAAGIGFKYLSMGMSADYKVAIEEGSNMVRIGSLIFGERS